MKTRQKLTEETAKRYCQAEKKEKGKILDEFTATTTLTDVYSGWTELRALLNRAQRWVKEGLDDIKKGLPFPMKGLDSDNGGEFKNLQLLE